MIDKIWHEQPPGLYCLALKNLSGKWTDKTFGSIRAALAWAKDHKRSGDLYFCVTTLSDSRRVKDNVQSSRYLWQDLDTVDPEKLGWLRPTIAWQSSPGRYQALWRLDKIYEPDRIERINRALAYRVGADRGSWILTKVLRIPGTTNYKYPKHPTVKLLWDDGNTFSIRKLERRLKPKVKDENEVEIDISLSFKKVFKKYRDILMPKVRRFLTADEAIEGKRSDILWYLENELIKAGLSEGEVYALVKGCVWNKYRDRNDEEKRLKSEISKVSLKIKEERVDTEVKDDSEPIFKMVVQNDTDFMSDIAHYPGWTVEGFWTKRSHGIVAGEPKSFKSTLVQDLAISIASGKKFLGLFDIVDPGPVLIVQNENAPWIMKDRNIKIRSNRDLMGEIKKVGGLYQVTFPPQLPLYYINQQGFSFTEPHHLRVLDKAMSSIKPRMVIFDPLYLMFDGDVNQSKDLNPVLTWLLQLKEKHDCAIVIIHHWKKGTQKSGLRGGQRMLGSTTLHGWVESAWYLNVKKVSDVDEEIFSDELNSPGGSVSLTLEREFRGAGTYPPIDITINMGDFGSTDYNIEVKKHRAERSSIDEKDIIESLKSLIELRGGKVTLREASKELGISRKIISKYMQGLKEE